MQAAPVILVTGATGQLGFDVVRELSTLGAVVAPSREALDLSSPKSIRAVVRQLKPAVIVNAGAYTAVDRAEVERERCISVNAHAPEILAGEARRCGAALIHYSTDYVFDGAQSTPYVETDVPAPLNVYGASKLAGEQAIASVGGAWMILRTSWLYGMRGHNFLRTILRLAREREDLRIVDDQAGAPTWSRSVATATGQLLSILHAGPGMVGGIADAAGLYHLASAGETSWYGFAAAILALDPRPAEQRCVRLHPVSTEEYAAPAARPRRSVLCSAKFARRFGLVLPDWKSQLALVLRGAEERAA